MSEAALQELLAKQEEQSRQLLRLIDFQKSQTQQLDDLTSAMLGMKESSANRGPSLQMAGSPPHLPALSATPREDNMRDLSASTRIVAPPRMAATPPESFESHEKTKPLSFTMLEPLALGVGAINAGVGALETTFSILTGRPRPQRRRIEKAPSMPMRGLNAEGRIVMVADVLFVITSSFVCIFAVSILNPVDRKSTLDGWQVVWIWHIQILSLIWVGLRFFVRRRVGKWTIVDNLQEIRSLYLRSWFAFDMLYCFPLELFFVQGYFVSSVGLYYSLPRHFLRFLRFTSLIDSVNPLTAFRQWFRFIAYISAILFISHTYAHLFLYLAITYEDPEVTKDLTYLDSLYWATASLTSVGYGDVPTTSPQGRALAVVVMTSGVAMVATFTAFSTAFLTFKDSLTQEQDARKSHMAAMLHYYQIPWDVQRQVIQVFPSIIDNETERQFREAVESMPQFVREKLMLYFNAHHLKQVSLFAGVADKNPEVLLEVTKTMVQHIYAPNEFIVRAGDEGHEMFIILSGTVEVFKINDDGESKLFATLSRGDWFGEQAVLSENDVCSADVATATTTEVLVLAKGPMMKVLHKCPDILEKIRRVTERRQQRSEKEARKKGGLGADFGRQDLSSSVPVGGTLVPIRFPKMDLEAHPLPEPQELLPMPHHTPFNIL